MGLRAGTRVVRAGHPAPEQGVPFLPGPQLAAPFHSSGDPSEVPHSYGRYSSPTWARYEQALGELEDGEAVLFASGMAAVTAVLLSSLGPGDSLVMPSDCYMQVRALAQGHLAATGVDVELLPTAQMAPEAVPAAPDVLWLETPSNPGLDVCDVAALARPGPGRARLVAVDNTFATPLGQRPLDLGADVSVTSATKHLSGHADLLLGSVVTRDPALAERLREWRKTAGSIAGPFEAWLAHRSLATLDVRLERGCTNAAAVAGLLAGRDDVAGLRYPGLASDPAHELAARQMSRFGTIVSFDLGSQSRAEAFLASARLVTEATSFGGVHTSAERRARWNVQGDTPSARTPPSDDVPEGFIRLSAGCEDPRDLLEDLERALDSL